MLPSYLQFNHDKANYVNVPYGRLYYETFGSGNTFIFLILGLYGIHTSFEEFIQYYGVDHANTYTIIVFDMVGVGFSHQFSFHRLTSSSVALQLTYLLDDVKVKRNKTNLQCHVIAYSFGGMVAQELCIVKPEIFLSLTLINTHYGGWSNIFPPQELTWNIVKTLWNMENHIYLLHPSTYFNTLKIVDEDEIKCEMNLSSVKSRKMYVYEKQRRQSMKYLNEKNQYSSLFVLFHILAVKTHNISTSKKEYISNLPFKKLVIQGLDDIIVHPSNAVLLHKDFNTDILLLKHTGHSIYPRSKKIIQRIHQMIHKPVIKRSSSSTIARSLTSSPLLSTRSSSPFFDSDDNECDNLLDDTTKEYSTQKYQHKWRDYINPFSVMVTCCFIGFIIHVYYTLTFMIVYFFLYLII